MTIQVFFLPDTKWQLATTLPNTLDVQFLSYSYDVLVKSESILSKALDDFSRKLNLLTVKVDKIDKAIDEMLYSYQYNLRIVNIPLISENKNCARHRGIVCEVIYRSWSRNLHLSYNSYCIPRHFHGKP